MLRALSLLLLLLAVALPVLVALYPFAIFYYFLIIVFIPIVSKASRSSILVCRCLLLVFSNANEMPILFKGVILINVIYFL